jgi:hypothetical protein
MISLEDDLVIFVHGSFVNCEKQRDKGRPGWWQRDSENWRRFDDNLPAGTSLPDESIQPFRWSGENSQVDRLEASNRLLALMIGLEKEGRGYHLIGHSHGGSIIWEALVSAEVTRSLRTVDPDLRRALNKVTPEGKQPLIPLRDDEYAPWWLKYKTRYIPQAPEFRAVEPFIDLAGLRSWTTVGTPFLHHLPNRRLLVKGWPHPKLSLNPEPMDTVRSSLVQALLMLVMMAPFLYLFSALISDPLRTALRNIPNNWFANLLTVLAALIWVTAFVTLGNRQYATALLAREHAAPRVMERFHKRWLGLWAPEDEAIAGLKRLAPDNGGYDYEWLFTPPRKRSERQAATRPDYPCADKFRPLLKVPVTDAYLIPHVQLLAPARIAKPVILWYNKFVAPAIGRGVIRIISIKAQGANLPHASLVYASPWPLPLERVCPGLPEEVVEEIQSRASQDAGRFGALARRLFMAATLEGLREAREIYEEVYEGSPLVHTSYFNHEAVQRLIVLHIARTSGDSTATAASSDFSDWLTANSAAVQAHVAEFIAERS